MSLWANYEIAEIVEEFHGIKLYIQPKVDQQIKVCFLGRTK